MHRHNKLIGARAALGLLALVVIAATTACTTGSAAATRPIAAATQHHTYPVSSDATAHPALSPISASFISASTGWLLARPPCAATGCTELRLRKTTDGGKHWFAVPAPPAPASVAPGSPADSVSQILFANARDGWAFDPALWATHDGGATWHRVSIHGTPVLSLAASDGRAIAAVGRCFYRGQPCGFKVYTSSVGTDRWLAVPGSAGTGDAPASVVASGRSGYVVDSRADLGRPVLLAGPADGSARWQPLANPCQGAWSAPLAAATGGWLVLGCGTEPGAGNQTKLVYLSHNRGRTWRRLTDPPSSGYLTAASIGPAGTIFLSGGRSDVYISWDTGRTWHTSRGLLSADISDGLAATAVTNTEGFVLQASLYFRQVWFTYNDGHTWTPVTVR